MTLTLFLITYTGIALGKVPGLVTDRVGIPVTLMPLIVLVVWGMI